MTSLDSAAGAAVHTTLAAAEGYATLETKVNLVRTITAGTVVHRGKRNLFAHTTSTCLIPPA